MKNTKKDLLPEPSIYDADGQPLFSLEDLIAYWELSVDEMKLLEKTFINSSQDFSDSTADDKKDILLN